MDFIFVKKVADLNNAAVHVAGVPVVEIVHNF